MRWCVNKGVGVSLPGCLWPWGECEMGRRMVLVLVWVWVWVGVGVWVNAMHFIGNTCHRIDYNTL